MQGWIILHRKITDSDIYKMPPLYLRVFERLIIEANHRDAEIPYKEKGSGVYRKKLIKRGERLTSIRNIAEWVAWYERGCLKVPNPKTISSILDYLMQENMIFVYDKGNKKETHYKIVNYEVYQDNTDDGSNNKVTVRKQSLDINNNENNENNENKNNNMSLDMTPYLQIKDLFNNICFTLPKIKDITDSRQKTVKARWKKYKNIEFFKEIFEKVNKSDFLSGRSGKWNGCCFDWIMKPSNLQKIIEGNYDNKNSNSPDEGWRM